LWPTAIEQPRNRCESPDIVRNRGCGGRFFWFRRQLDVGLEHLPVRVLGGSRSEAAHTGHFPEISFPLALELGNVTAIVIKEIRLYGLP
jgi:hypothetical protein